MSDNYNIDTTQAQSYTAGGLNPTDPTQTLGEMLAKRAMDQREQEQLVQQAVERTKQSKVKTAEDTSELETKGYLSQKGQVPKAQALVELKAILQKDGWEDADIAKLVAEAEQSWPGVVNASDIRGFISAMRENRVTKLGEGNPFPAKPGMTDPETGEPLSSGSYQDIVDTEGNHHYVKSNVPAAVQSAGIRGDSKMDGEWLKLGDAVRKYTQSARGNMIMNTITRAKQALALLASYGDNPPAQVLGQVYNDISSIMQGGVGTQEGVEMAAYKNVLVDLNNKLGYYTGHYSLVTAGWKKLAGGMSPLREILDHLRKTLSELINVAAETVKAQLESEEAVFRSLIETDPQRFQDMINQKMGIINSGLPQGMTATVPAASPAAPAAHDPLGIL